MSKNNNIQYQPTNPPNTNTNSFKNKKTDRTLSHKVVIIGDANVGKTCLITRFNKNIFQETSPTIGAIHYIQAVENISLDIWDTAGQERFKSMIPLYYKGAKAIIICFDITNLDSFEGAQNWHTEIFDSVKKSIIVLCGTKRDLDEKRQINFSDAKKFADFKGIKYFETSSKEDYNIQELFKYVAEQITLENLKKEIEGVDLNSMNSLNVGKKLEKSNKKKNYNNLKLKTKCCGA